MNAPPATATTATGTNSMPMNFFDMVKIETNLAVLIKRGTKVAWIPKSCLYKLEEASDSEIGSVWVLLSFKLDWREDC